MSFRLLLLIFITGIGGCGFHYSGEQWEIEQPVVLEDTPFYAQSEYQCGPAALAMVLVASGVTIHPDELTPYTYIPERKGTLQLELLAAARLHGRIPYVIEPGVDSLLAELEGGRPVLVLQNLGLNILPAYHYAVVIGMLPPDKIVLHTGEQKRAVEDRDTFMRTWERTESWGMVVIKPGELPASLHKIPYLRAVSAFESSGNVTQAGEAYQAALAQWPDDETVLFGLANNYLAQNNYSDARSLFKELLEKNPENIAAANNLAETYLQQGCYAAAQGVIDKAIAAAGEESKVLMETLLQTQDEITELLHGSESSPDAKCPP